IVFFWNNMFSKQSKEAFQTISENLYKRKDNVFINLILINTDIPYIDFFKTSKKTSNKQMP
ncbi:hypothetical protein, partial [Sphingobacterium rhinopitheci]|uniref:hypothetical protein n=1 Tax=Sphingobacterium rhinopitheci TaxID=2781960 RepID=UPI001F51D395